MTDDASLRADCGRCAGLCCVALAFDRSALFGEDKPAGQACRHLSARDNCSIHAHRAEQGFGGCAGYDCLGAGQLVTQDLFGGRSWRDCADGGSAMFAAFARMRRVQEWRLLLVTAMRLPLTLPLEQRRRMLLARLAADSGWTIVALERATDAGMAAEMSGFILALRAIAPRPEPNGSGMMVPNASAALRPRLGAAG